MKQHPKANLHFSETAIRGIQGELLEGPIFITTSSHLHNSMIIKVLHQQADCSVQAYHAVLVCPDASNLASLGCS